MSHDKCKVGIVSERYDLDGHEIRYESLDDRLLTRWTGSDGRESSGYRRLTDWFNMRLLRVVYDENGRDTTGKRIEHDYEALTGDDNLHREEVIDNIRSDGINTDALQRDMISWNSMRTHLKSCLDGEKVVRESDSDWERQSIEIAKNISESKIREALSSLDNKGELPGGKDADIEVQFLLSCPECPTRIPFSDAVERGFVCKEHNTTMTSTKGSN